jgi:YD repeat-containing protein
MRNAAGEEIKFVRDAARNLVSITSPHGHWIKFSYDGENRIATARDDAGQLLNYSYDPSGGVAEVSGDRGRQWSYSYIAGHISSVRNSAGTVLFFNQYRHGLIDSARLPDGSTYHFDYLFGRDGGVVETTVIGPEKKVRVFRF